MSISNFDKDFGIDGTFRQITAIGNRRFTSGYALDFQLKASINYLIESEYIVYDLEAKTYNDLVDRVCALAKKYKNRHRICNCN